MIHWPTWRPARRRRDGERPRRAGARCEKSGPSIHGIGVAIRAKAKPAPAPIASPADPSEQPRPFHLPMQKREKITPSRSSAVNSPVIAESAVCASRSSSARSSSGGVRAARCCRRARKVGRRFAQRVEMPLAREKRVLHVLVRAGQREDFVAQQLDAFARLRRQPHVPRASGVAPRRARFRVRAPDRSCCGRRCAAALPATARGSRHRAGRVARPRLRIDHHQRDVRARDGRPGPLDADRFDRVVGGAQSRGVDHRERNAVDLDLARDRVARRARNRRDDRDVLAGEPVEQARLADVGTPDQHHSEPVAQQRALRRALAELRASAPRSASSRPAASAARTKPMSSSGKSSDASTSMRSSISACDDRVDRAREFAREAAHRGARRRRRRGVDEIGDALGLHEVELAVEERALREFAGLREAARPARRNAQGRAAARRARRGPAVRGRLRRCRSAAPERRARCPRRARSPEAPRKIAAVATRGASARPTMPATTAAHAGTGHANDADAAAPRRRGDRGNGVGRGSLIAAAIIAPPSAAMPGASAVSPQRPRLPSPAGSSCATAGRSGCSC